MSPETPKPQSQSSSPEMYEIPTVSSDALEQARVDAQEFANTVNEASRSFIDVTDVPGHEDRVEVKHEAVNPETKREFGHSAIEHAKKTTPLDAVTPQMMRNALGRPYQADSLGRIVPKEK